MHGEIHLSKAKNKEKFKLNYMELNKVQNTPCDFNIRSFFLKLFSGETKQSRRDLLNIQIPFLMLGHQHFTWLSKKVSKYSKISYVLNQTNWGKICKSQRKKITILSYRLQML